MSEPQLTDEPAETPPDFRLADHLGDDGPFAYPASGDTLTLRALFQAGAGAGFVAGVVSGEGAAVGGHLRNGRKEA